MPKNLKPRITVPRSAGLGQTSQLSDAQLKILVAAWRDEISCAADIKVQPWDLDDSGAVKKQYVPWSTYCADVKDGCYHQNLNTAVFGVRLLAIEGCVPDHLPGLTEAWTTAVNYASSEDILYGGKDSASWLHVDTPIPMVTRITVRTLPVYSCQLTLPNCSPPPATTPPTCH